MPPNPKSTHVCTHVHTHHAHTYTLQLFSVKWPYNDLDLKVSRQPHSPDGPSMGSQTVKCMGPWRATAIVFPRLERAASALFPMHKTVI